MGGLQRASQNEFSRFQKVELFFGGHLCEYSKLEQGLLKNEKNVVIMTIIRLYS